MLGLLGFFFVLAVPYAIARLGVTAVIVCWIAAQIAASLVWDRAVEGATPSVSKFDDTRGKQDRSRPNRLRRGRRR